MHGIFGGHPGGVSLRVFIHLHRRERPMCRSHVRPPISGTARRPFPTRNIRIVVGTPVPGCPVILHRKITLPTGNPCKFPLREIRKCTAFSADTPVGCPYGCLFISTVGDGLCAVPVYDLQFRERHAGRSPQGIPSEKRFLRQFRK